MNDFSKFLHACAGLLPDMVRAVPQWIDDESIQKSLYANVMANEELQARARAGILILMCVLTLVLTGDSVRRYFISEAPSLYLAWFVSPYCHIKQLHPALHSAPVSNLQGHLQQLLGVSS